MKEKIQKLFRLIDIQEDKNECRSSKLFGVGGLSRSDLDMIRMYATEIERCGGVQNISLMQPSGNIELVLRKAGLINGDLPKKHWFYG